MCMQRPGLACYSQWLTRPALWPTKHHTPNLCLISPGSVFVFFFPLKCHRVWTNWHTSVSLQHLHPPFSFFYCGFKQMQSNPIRGEWEQHRRGTGNSNFVQLVPAVTGPHLNEPLDNPQKYDPTKGGKEAVCPLSSLPAERLLTGLSASRGTTVTQMSRLGQGKWHSCFVITCNG